METGTNGQPIPVASDWVRPMVPGGDVQLTILSGLQWEAQQACAQQVRLTRADSCTVVVMRPASGQILAMAQYPGYQPVARDEPGRHPGPAGIRRVPARQHGQGDHGRGGAGARAARRR